MPRLRPASWSSSKVSGPSVGVRGAPGQASARSSVVVIGAMLAPQRRPTAEVGEGVLPALALAHRLVGRAHHATDRPVADVVVADGLARHARGVEDVLVTLVAR